MNNIVKAIFDTRVDPEILRKVVAAFAKMEVEDRQDITERAITIIQILDACGLLDSQPDLAAAIEFRLKALARLSDRPELKAWSIPGDVEGMIRIEPVVLEATAMEPLHEDGDRAVFDPTTFFQRLMYVTEDAGQA